jgi:hypothetical protein
VTKAQHVVEGKGHHVNPVELWDKQGFTDKGAHEIFDKATLPAPDHNYTAHGAKSGYTAQVEAEFDTFRDDWVTKNKASATVGEMSAKQQQQLAQDFVDHLKPGGATKNEYINGFNKAVQKGPNEVARWAASEGKAAFQPLIATEARYVAQSGKVVPFLKYAGRGVAKLAVVGGVVLGGASIANAANTDGAQGGLIETGAQLGSFCTLGVSDVCRAIGDVQSWHINQAEPSAGENSYYGWMTGFSYW